MTGCFITGSGTEIGKTVITTILARQLRARGRNVRALKPVISGYSEAEAAASDSGRLLWSVGRDVTPEAVADISPWRYTAPLSPDMAAAREGRAIDFDGLIAYCREEADRAARDGAAVLIEGIGGVMVPLTQKQTVLDWLAAVGLPAILVSGSYLGSLSHTLTALTAMASRNVRVSAVIVSESPDNPVTPDETVNAIARFTDPIPVYLVPRITPDDPASWGLAPDLCELALETPR